MSGVDHLPADPATDAARPAEPHLLAAPADVAPPASEKGALTIEDEDESNHLRLPQPLDPVKAPKTPSPSRNTLVFVGHLSGSWQPPAGDGSTTVRRRGCHCCTLLFWLCRRQPSRPDADSIAEHTTGQVRVQLGVPQEAATQAVTQAKSEPCAPTPAAKGKLRSPFVDGLRSVSRDAPGRLVRALTRGQSSGASSQGGFSLHA